MYSVQKLAGGEAVHTWNEYRSRYVQTGEYPFLIGDEEQMERLREASDLNERSPAEIIRASFEVHVAKWIENRKADFSEFAKECGDTTDEPWSEWPGECPEKGAIGIHLDCLTKKILPEVYLGLAKIEQPWQLPAVAKFGDWNDCPAPEVQCAFHRYWYKRYAAEITSMSSEIVECRVGKPPLEEESAIALAREQYWYCTDIVDQGVVSVPNLASLLLNSPYWYFWWD